MNYPGTELVRSTKEAWAQYRATRRYLARAEPDPKLPWLTEEWLRKNHGPHFIDIRAEEFKFEIRILVERAITKVAPRQGLALRRARLNPINDPRVMI